MTVIHTTFVILCCIISITSAFSGILCGTACICQNNEEEGLVSVDCSRSYLSIVPPVPDWPENITHLDLSTNNITKLDMELAHSQLQVLDLSQNNLQTPVQNAFGGLKSLKYLNLANNDIKEFVENAFYGLEHLQSLNLSGNSLFFLADSLFYNFIGLQELSLSNNPLMHLNPTHLNRMISLRWLDLSSIETYTLDPKLFHTTGQLDFLDLSSNKFIDVPIDALRSAKKLRHLKLNENPISTLDRKSFTQLTSLKVLELNFLDQLKKIEDETFSDLKSLMILDIKHGRQLYEISPLAFNGLFNDTRPVLQELDLQGNQLRTFRKSTVPCAKLRKFNLQQNPWVCDCMLQWIKDCQIQRLYMADLKCASPRKLSGFLISTLDNDEFKCDFLDSELARSEIHHDRVVRSVTVALGVTMLVVLSLSVALVFKWRSMKEWYRKHRKGPGAVYYVRARANPQI